MRNLKASTVWINPPQGKTIQQFKKEIKSAALDNDTTSQQFVTDAILEKLERHAKDKESK